MILSKQVKLKKNRMSKRGALVTWMRQGLRKWIGACRCGVICLVFRSLELLGDDGFLFLFLFFTTKCIYTNWCIFFLSGEYCPTHLETEQKGHISHSDIFLSKTLDIVQDFIYRFGSVCQIGQVMCLTSKVDCFRPWSAPWQMWSH